jgi:SAM-dependent methyltransferase
MKGKSKELKNKGLGIAKAHTFEDESSSMIHEQLARLKFAESQIAMEGKKVLDFGCGTGYNTYYISERKSPELIVGIDILEECIAYCKKNYSTAKTKYYIQDCFVHNPNLGLFDVAICCEVIEHVMEQNLFLDALKRYIKPNGVAFISTPNRALFSLTKENSFSNNTHVKELYYNEFTELVKSKFSACKFYSQLFNPNFHSAVINVICAKNLEYAFRHEILGENIMGKIASNFIKYCIRGPLTRINKFPNKDYPNIRSSRFTDFEFVEGYDNHAMWFNAICSNPI